MTVLSRSPEHPDVRVRRFAREHQFQPVAVLGVGQEGEVYSTEAGTVLKVHLFREPAAREIAVYERLKERGVFEVAGHAVPVLLAADAAEGVIHMTMVKQPFVLDLSRARFQRPVFPDDGNPLWPTKSASSRRFLAEEVPIVRRIREELWRRAGVWITDLHAGNVGFPRGRGC